MVQVHDALHVEIVVSIHAKFFEHAGLVRGGAGGVVVFEPLQTVGGACWSARVLAVSFTEAKRTGGRARSIYLPVVIGVEMEGAEVDGWQVEDCGEIFPGRAVVIEIPVVGAGAVVEEAVSAEGDEVVGVEGFDVLAYLIGPGGQDLAAVAVGVFASSLRLFRLGWIREMAKTGIPRWRAPMRILRGSLCIW